MAERPTRRLNIEVTISEVELRALLRGSQVVNSAADGTDLAVQREYDSISMRLRRVYERAENRARRLRHRSEEK